MKNKLLLTLCFALVLTSCPGLRASGSYEPPAPELKDTSACIEIPKPLKPPRPWRMPSVFRCDCDSGCDASLTEDGEVITVRFRKGDLVSDDTYTVTGSRNDPACWTEID